MFVDIKQENRTKMAKDKDSVNHRTLTITKIVKWRQEILHYKNSSVNIFQLKWKYFISLKL